MSMKCSMQHTSLYSHLRQRVIQTMGISPRLAQHITAADPRTFCRPAASRAVCVRCVCPSARARTHTHRHARAHSVQPSLYAWHLNSNQEWCWTRALCFNCPSCDAVLLSVQSSVCSEPHAAHRVGHKCLSVLTPVDLVLK